MKRMMDTGLMARGGMGPFLFLGIILAVMIAGLIYTTRVGSERDSEVERKEKGESNRGITFITTDFDPKVATWGPINDETLEGQQDIPVAAFNKAADIVAMRPWNRMRSAGNVVDKEIQGFGTLDVEAVFADPNKARGLPVEVLGRLESLEPFDLFDAYTHKLPDGRYKVLQGSMRCRKGKHKSAALVRFTLLDKVEPNGPVFVPGAQVKLQGVFFKLQRFDTKNGPETGIWILGKRLLKSYKLPTGDEIDLSKLATVRDAVTAVDAARDPLEERPFYHLMASVREGHKVEASEILHLKGKQLRRLLTEPEALRGKTIEFGARVMRVDHHSMSYWFPEHDEEDNPINEFWITYVTPDDNFPMTILWLKEPPRDLKKRDQVRMKAVFYRIWAYNRKKGQTKSPLLVGIGDIDVFTVEPKTGLDDPVTAGLIGFAFLVIVLVIAVLAYDRRRASLFADTLAAKRKLHRKRGNLTPKADSEENAADQGPLTGAQ